MTATPLDFDLVLSLQVFYLRTLLRNFRKLAFNRTSGLYHLIAKEDVHLFESGALRPVRSISIS